MKKHLILLLLLLCHFITFGQELNIKFSSTKSFPFSLNLKKHLHSDSTGHYFLFQKGKSFKSPSLIIVKYDTNFRKVFAQKLDSGEKNTIHQGVIFHQNKFIWFYNIEKKKPKSVSAYLSEVDLEGNIIKSDKIESINYERKNDKTNFFWKISDDSSKILIYNILSKPVEKEDLKAKVIVLDSNDGMMWKNEFTLDMSSKDFGKGYWKLTNNGNLIFTKAARNNRTLYYLTKELEEPESIIYNPERKLLNNLVFKEVEKGKVVGASFYELKENSTADLFNRKKKKAKKLIGGLYTIEINTTDFEYEDNYEKMPRGDYSYGRNDLVKGSKGQGIELTTNNKVSDIYLNKDKEVVIISEENYPSILDYYARIKPDDRFLFDSRYLEVTTLNHDYSIKHISIIPKYQILEDINLYVSHVRFTTKGKTYFLYTDHKNNIKKETDFKILRNRLMLATVLTYISPDGKLIRENILTKKNLKRFVSPRLCKQINENQLLVVSIKKSKMTSSTIQFGIIEIR